MKSFKKYLIVFAAVTTIGLSGLHAFAQQVGVVDLDRVVNNYSKAQDVSADLKVKEAELQKFLADAQKQLKDATSPVEKKNLENKLTKQFKTKSDEFKDAQIKQWKQIEDNIFSAIETVSKTNKLDVVLVKSSVLYGGTDLSDQILNLLNTSAQTSTDKK
ncbi:MAG: OmpH family outer membrane protein [Candidatus Gastranaerophilales bacterium]|nr:OmpH family outer membrane protein [Candidatus Gastranaerophilales bacterium]